MATKNYQYRVSVTASSTTDPNIFPYGISGSDQSWHTTTAESGTVTETYWYTDSNAGDALAPTNYSRVYVTIQDSWTASVDSRNNLTISVTSVITSIARGSVTGTPTTTTTGRDITVYRYEGGPAVFSVSNDQIGTAHTIATDINLGTDTFTLAPGQDASRSSVYYFNKTHNIDSYDQLWMGVHFRNILPADYRPGKIWNGSAWMSHNRNAGAANIRGGSSNWIEMRTVGDGTMTNNPPYMRHSDGWRDMRLIGAE